MMHRVVFPLLAFHVVMGAPPKDAKNVVFIVSDDMRPSLSPYGLKEGHTPNIQRLADEGIVFRHAYVQFSYCAPSRNSFMSGRRPDSTKVYNFIDHFREAGVGKSWTALPEHFKNNGYLVTGGGKLYHEGVPPNFDQPRSWSEKGPDGTPWPYIDSGGNQTNLCKEKCCGSNDTTHYCLFDVKPGTMLQDQKTQHIVTPRLREAIDNWKQKGQPFFVGFGYHKPHLNWEFPKSFYDLVDPQPTEATHKAWPADVPAIGFHDCAEMSHAYWNTDGWGVPPGKGHDYFSGHQSEMRRAYYGCISYVDSLIGDVLDVLDEMGVTNDTVVSLVGDHGWHLGEHDMWCKMSNLELGTRIPMIYRAPWKTNAKGVMSSALAEAVDLYPTLSELAGLTLPPPNAGGEYLGGTSLVPVFDDPKATVKDVALSQFPRCWQNNTDHTGQKPGDENNRTVSWESMSDCHWTRRGGLDFMGYRMRTPDFSITQWVRWDTDNLRPLWDDTVGVELYDHRTDDGIAPAAFDNFENVNLAGNPQYADLQKTLLAQLKTNAEKWITPNPVE